MNVDVNVLNEQLKMFIGQREQASKVFYQAQGAIAVLEEQVRLISANKEPEAAPMEKEDGEVIKQESCEITQE